MTRTKRVVTMLTVLALTAALAAPALALGPIDTAMTGSIGLTVADEVYRDDFAAQDPAAPIEVLVYKLADVDENGVFSPVGAFLPLAEDPAWNGGILNDALTDIAALQAAAEELVYGAPAEPAEGEEAQAEREPALPADITASIDAAGGSKIDLAEHGLGLYLLIPQKTETTQWVYTFNAILLAVPSVPAREADPEGGIPAEGDWLYDISVDLKAERERRLTGIVIEKTLREYNTTLGATTFLFDVQADIGGEHVFSQLVPLTFSGTGTQSVTVEGIPVGAHVTVTEVYSGASYEVVNGQASIGWLPLPDEVEGMYRVPFTNTYTDRQNPDTSLVNTWVREGEGWTWQSGEEAG